MAKITNAATIAEIERILFAQNPHYETRFWIADGVECRRDRHRHAGQAYGFSLEVFQLRYAKPGRPAWQALIVSERWTAGVPENSLRVAKWVKILAGKASDVRDWVHGARSRAAGAEPRRAPS